MLARPPSTSAAQRQRRSRALRRAGRVVLRVEVDLGATADWLAEKKFLAQWDAEDAHAVTRALEQALAAWTRYQA